MKTCVTAGCCDSQHQHDIHDDESTRNNDAQDESSQTNLSFQRPVIGSQVGQEFVDIINGLHPTFTNINSLIFQYLNSYDLCVMCLVSKSWNQIVKSHSIANSRRIKRLKKIRRIKADVGQENWPIKRRSSNSINNAQRRVLSSVENNFRKQKAPTAHYFLRHLRR